MTTKPVASIGACPAVCWSAASVIWSTEGQRHIPRGRQLYAKHCRACYGPQGRDDGAARFDPPTADLTLCDVLLKPDSRLLRSIHEGWPNSAMDAWKSAMSDETIQDVLADVPTFPR